jgi:hypothetical protein
MSLFSCFNVVWLFNLLRVLDLEAIGVATLYPGNLPSGINESLYKISEPRAEWDFFPAYFDGDFDFRFFYFAAEFITGAFATYMGVLAPKTIPCIFVPDPIFAIV